MMIIILVHFLLDLILNLNACLNRNEKFPNEMKEIEVAVFGEGHWALLSSAAPAEFSPRTG